MSASFTVVIPTLNEADSLRACIKHLRLLHSEVEIIVADGGSSDDTIRIAESDSPRRTN
jgi:glycosyltransferase involved in cell wall biosynthesis